MYKEIEVLTEASQILVNKVFRLKYEAQEVDLNKGGNTHLTNGTSMMIKVAYVSESSKILVEVVNVHNITPREKRSSNIQMFVRFSSGKLDTGQIVEHTTVFRDVGTSFIFELQGGPARFEFNMDNLSHIEEFEDAFIIVDLFHVNLRGLDKLFIGECLLQVNKRKYFQ